MMPYNNYKKIEDVLLAFGISYTEQNFIQASQVETPAYFASEIELTLKEGVYKNSEYALCETLIYPALREIWKLYKADLLLWSHQPLYYDENLCGIPDYMVAKRSPMGKIFFEKPFLIIVEAKKDNFEEGWSQCIAATIAAQKINNNSDLTASVFGIVSTGVIWEFGMLSTNQFVKEITIYTIQNLNLLFSALKYMFEQSKLQIAIG
jgi:hypothetical protein